MGIPPPCAETECVVPGPELKAMHEALQRYKRERDEAIEAWATMRARAQAIMSTTCGQFT